MRATNRSNDRGEHGLLKQHIQLLFLLSLSYEYIVFSIDHIYLYDYLGNVHAGGKELTKVLQLDKVLPHGVPQKIRVLIKTGATHK